MSTRSERYRGQETPTGIKIVCLLGWIHAALGLLRLPGLAAGIFPGVASVLGGLPGLVLTLVPSVGQAVVLYGLWKLEPWGWRWTVAVLGLLALVELVLLPFGRGSHLSLAVEGVVLAYVYGKRDLYLRGRRGRRGRSTST